MTDLLLNAICTLLLIFVTATAVICFFQCSDRRLMRSYVTVSGCVFGWLLAVLLYRVTQDKELAVFLDNLPLPFVAFLPVALLLMTLHFYNRGKIITKKRILLLCIIPLCTTCIVLSPPLRFLIRYGHVMVSTAPLHLTDYTWNWWFYLHTAYSYLVSMASVVVAIIHHRYRPSGYAIPSGLLVASILCTLAGNVFTIIQVLDIDATMVTSSIGLVILYIAIANNPAVDFLMIAQRQLVRNMEDAVFIMNKQRQVVETNTAALHWLREIGFQAELPYDFEQVKRHLDAIGGTVKSSELQPDGQNIFLYISGELVVYTLSEKQVVDRKGSAIGSYYALTDITQYSKMIAWLEQEADIDQLTGIANRRVYEQQCLEMDRMENLPLSVMIADVNGLKSVNDRFGHHQGDDLLRLISKTMARLCPQNAVYARIGGDEFAMILPRCTEESVRALMEKVKASLRREESELYLPSVALGAATKTHMGQNLQELVDTADKNMYLQKEYDRRER